MHVATDFAKQLLVINVIGITFWAVLGLLIWPTTNRAAFQSDLLELLDRIEGCLAMRLAAMRDAASWIGNRPAERSASEEHVLEMKQKVARNVDSSTAALLATYTRMQVAVSYAQREVGLGHLSGKDLQHIHGSISNVLKPLIGLMASLDYVSKLPVQSNVEWHRLALQASLSKAEETHEVLVGTLCNALMSLGIQAVRSKVQTLEVTEDLSVRPLATLKSLLRDLRAASQIDLERWPDLAAKPGEPEQKDAKQSLLCLTLQVFKPFRCTSSCLIARRLKNCCWLPALPRWTWLNLPSRRTWL